MSARWTSAAAILALVLLVSPGSGYAAPDLQEVKPYDPSLMRLAEVLGALTYLRGLCGEKDSPQWRARMQALLDAEGTTTTRKDLLAGAYNSGLQGYALSYRSCTPNAHVIIDRFLGEASRIAKSLENRYKAT
jgi:uncharacterized protein (TIGR02301 family)